MIKTMGRFALLVVLCLMFVYAPEILSSVSAPYSMAGPQRALLRIALCCESESAVSSLYKTLGVYQKAYPCVHLRVTRTAPDQLSSMSAPYPDVVLCPDALVSQLPAGFFTPYASPVCDLLCAVSSDSSSHETAAEFAAYLYETTAPQNTSSEF